MVVEGGRPGQSKHEYQANAGGTSETAGGAYSNSMSLRRIVGCTVMALLLASVALPAMCGACMGFAAKPACGENHDGAATGNKQLSMTMSGHCADCGDRPGINAKETGRRAPVSEFVFLDCERRICVQAGEQNATIYRDGVIGHRLVGDRTTFGGSAEIARPALRAVHLNVFGSEKITSGNSAYHPLLVSLKI
jgi:hypothetical protein